MKNFWSIIISILLLVLIVLTLIQNKKEIELKVEYAEKKLDTIPVRTVKLKSDLFTKELRYTGVIRPITSIFVNAPVQGKVLDIFPEVGSKVNSNTTLIKVDDTYLKAEYQIDKKNYELAQKNLERVENLSDEKSITGQQLDQIENQVQSAEIKKGITEKRLNETWVKSPVKGNINQFFIEKGMLISPTVPICEIVDITKFKVSLKVTESEAVQLHTGQKVKIIPQSNPSESLVGEIKYISLNADYALQYTVDIEFENHTDWLKGGMVCDIIITLQDDQKELIVPKKCIVTENEHIYLFVAEDNKAFRKDVNILDENDSYYKIEANLSENQDIIFEGQSKLTDGVPIKIISS